MKTIVLLNEKTTVINHPQQLLCCLSCATVFSPYARAYILEQGGRNLYLKGIDCPNCNTIIASVQDWKAPERKNETIKDKLPDQYQNTLEQQHYH